VTVLSELKRRKRTSSEKEDFSQEHKTHTDLRSGINLGFGFFVLSELSNGTPIDEIQNHDQRVGNENS
jgi:hypothetical protein